MGCTLCWKVDTGLRIGECLSERYWKANASYPTAGWRMSERPLGELCGRTRTESMDECILIQAAPDTIAVGNDLTRSKLQ